MYFLTIVLDGGIIGGQVKEGAGSLIQAVIGVYALAKQLDLEFHFTELVNIGHSEGSNMDQKSWDRKWNNYIIENLLPESKSLINYDEVFTVEAENLDILVNDKVDKKVLLKVEYSSVKKYIDNHIEILDNILDHLRNGYDKSKKDTYYEKDKKTIAIHIRMFTPNDGTDIEDCREYFNVASHMESYIREIIMKISEKYNSPSIHIYSEGNLDTFKNLLDLNINFHLNEDPLLTIHHLIKADVLFMAKSSFSYIASFYNKGDKYIRSGFWHTLLPDIKILNDNIDL